MEQIEVYEQEEEIAVEFTGCGAAAIVNYADC